MEAKLNPNRYVQCAGKLHSVKSAFTASGKQVATVSMSLSNGKDEKSGEWRESTWVEWQLWGDLAASVANLQKGDFISLKGNIGHQSWMDKTTNQPRSKIIFKAVQLSLDPANP